MFAMFANLSPCVCPSARSGLCEEENDTKVLEAERKQIDILCVLCYVFVLCLSYGCVLITYKTLMFLFVFCYLCALLC